MTAPTETANTEPVDGFTVAIDELLLLQTPPEVASVSIVFAPTHTVDAPAIAAIEGAALTVITFVATAEPHDEVTV